MLFVLVLVSLAVLTAACSSAMPVPPTATPTTPPTSVPIPTATPSPRPTSTPTPTATPLPPYASVWAGLANSRWLELNRPELAAAIVSLPWVSDGIDNSEQESVQELVHLAAFYESALRALISKPWVLDGVDKHEVGITQSTYWAAENSGEAVALEILAMPFLESVEPSDVDAVDTLSAVGLRGPELFSALLDQAWVADGLDDPEREVVVQLLRVAKDDQAATLSILGLPFLGTVEPADSEAVETLSNVASYGSEILSAVLDSAWVPDGLDALEVEVVEHLVLIAGRDEVAALRVLGMPFMETVEPTDAESLQELYNVAFQGADLFSAVLDQAWVADGLDGTDAEIVEHLALIAGKDKASALRLVAMPFLGSVEPADAEALQNLYGVAFHEPEVHSSLLNRAWVADGLSGSEVEVVENLGWIASLDKAAALRLLNMPFLDSVEPVDGAAMQSLLVLIDRERQAFDRVLAHPTLRGGITHSWAKVVSVLHRVNEVNPPLVSALLDPTQVTLEEQSITLPLAGEVDLAIIRTGPGAARSMELLEHAVRHAESYMEAPFPTGYVGLLFGDAVTPSFAGSNSGTHITSLARYDIDDGSHDAEYAASLIAHEVAHYYWRGNSDWVDEGAADFMASTAERARIGQPVEATNQPCGYVGSIAELENLEPSRNDGADSAFTCNYALGERLFVDLHHNLGEEYFRLGFQNLYLLSLAEGEETTELGIDQVTEAFTSIGGAAPPRVDTVVRRWYDGTEPYDTSDRDMRPVEPWLPSINGSVDAAYVATDPRGAPGTIFSAQGLDDWIWLTLKYSYSLVAQVHEVDLEIVDYYEDGLVFDRRNSSFTARPQYIGGTKWVGVGGSPAKLLAKGRYWTFVYHEGRKVAEVEYRVTS